jgi:uncharacterized membrane protein
VVLVWLVLLVLLRVLLCWGQHDVCVGGGVVVGCVALRGVLGCVRGEVLVLLVLAVVLVVVLVVVLMLVGGPELCCTERHTAREKQLSGAPNARAVDRPGECCT